MDAQAARPLGTDPLGPVLEAAVSFYHQRLIGGRDTGAARAYLRSRGYDSHSVRRFRLGHAPEGRGWRSLVYHLSAQGVPDQALMEAGLAVRVRSGALRDFFHGRVVIPLFDPEGRPVGFSARLLSGEGPKYLNSPETPLYHKAELLYGLYWAAPAIRRRSRAVVVEGYTDLHALHGAGFPETVATGGTALTAQHLHSLASLAPRVTLAFDADPAGRRAPLQAVECQAQGDVEISVACLPEGRDPADLVRGGEGEALRRALEEAVPLTCFRIEQLVAGAQEPEERARALRAAAHLVAQAPTARARRAYAHYLARRMDCPPETVAEVVSWAAGSPRSSARALAARERRLGRLGRGNALAR